MKRLFGRGPWDGLGRIAGPWPRDPSLGALPASCDVPEDCRFGTGCAGPREADKPSLRSRSAGNLAFIALDGVIATTQQSPRLAIRRLTRADSDQPVSYPQALK